MIWAYFFVAYLLFINILAFILYGVDKKKAVRNRYRIPERVLLWMARLGGGFGSWLGMMVFHHKKKHSKFKTLVPLWIIIWMFVIAGVLIFSGESILDEIMGNVQE